MSNKYETIKVFPETKVQAKTAAAALSVTMAEFINTAVAEKIDRDLARVLSIAHHGADTGMAQADMVSNIRDLLATANDKHGNLTSTERAILHVIEGWQEETAVMQEKPVVFSTVIYDGAD